MTRVPTPLACGLLPHYALGTPSLMLLSPNPYIKSPLVLSWRIQNAYAKLFAMLILLLQKVFSLLSLLEGNLHNQTPSSSSSPKEIIPTWWKVNPNLLLNSHLQASYPLLQVQQPSLVSYSSPKLQFDQVMLETFPINHIYEA